MTENTSCRSLVTGDYREAEFADAFGNSDLPLEFVDWPELFVDSVAPADFLVVAQSRRGKFSQSDVYRLIKAWPLAEKVLLVGSWCEGETRSGQPVQGLPRIYLRDWPQMMYGWLDQWSDRGNSALARANCESRADFLQATVKRSPLAGRLNLALHSHVPDSLATISDLCRCHGWKVVRLKECERFDLCIVDCYYGIEEAIRVADEVADRLARVPVVVMCGFPRFQDRHRLRERFDRVVLVGKPFDNDLLAGTIRRLMEGSRFQLVGHVA
jgi:hypothetical protein